VKTVKALRPDSKIRLGSDRQFNGMLKKRVHWWTERGF